MWWMVAALAADPQIVSLDPAIAESSGLARSSVDGVFWTHGDSGTEPLLFAIDREGRLRATVRVTGATNLDWEDLTSDGAGHLWIGDIGNNANNRRDLAVHRVP
jgi:hypothetical protein